VWSCDSKQGSFLTARREPWAVRQGRRAQSVLTAALLLSVAPAVSWAEDNQSRLNFFGMPGHITLPAARPLPDADLALSVRLSDARRLGGITFQVTPRLTGAFRYGRIDRNDSVVYDRSFDLQYQLIQPTDGWPGLAVGLRDFIGTGVLSSEYLVATFDPLPDVTASIGLGWGALGAAADVPALFSASRPAYRGLGGEPGLEQWFRGPAAFFAGVNWRVTPSLTLSAEYSGEDADHGGAEAPGTAALGVSYAPNDSLRVSGSTDTAGRIGLGLDYIFNPRAVRGRTTTVPPTGVASPGGIQDDDLAGLAEALSAQGIGLRGGKVSGASATLRLENRRYRSTVQALGRSTRVLLATLHASVETYHLEMSSGGPASSRVTVRRADLLGGEGQPQVAALDWEKVQVSPVEPWQGDWLSERRAIEMAVKPYLAFSLFDPDSPLRGDFGLEASVVWRIAPNLRLDGALRARLAGNRAASDRLSDSVLPPVRSDAVRYAREGEVTLPRLTLTHDANVGRDAFSRVSVGYLEEMFAGAAVEVLWKPTNSRLGVGLELAHVWQRDPGFSLGTGYYSYATTTGFMSLYYALTPEYDVRLDLGQYLAGDRGGTLAIERRFANGWRVGAYGTLTDVSFEDFGEGSFDKGIYLTVPIELVTGSATTARAEVKIQPILRDGGARLNLGTSLYEAIRPGQVSDLKRDWLSFKD